MPDAVRFNPDLAGVTRAIAIAVVYRCIANSKFTFAALEQAGLDAKRRAGVIPATPRGHLAGRLAATLNKSLKGPCAPPDFVGAGFSMRRSASRVFCWAKSPHRGSAWQATTIDRQTRNGRLKPSSCTAARCA